MITVESDGNQSEAWQDSVFERTMGSEEKIVN